MKETSNSTFIGPCAVGFKARASRTLARKPVLALFATALGVGPGAADRATLADAEIYEAQCSTIRSNSRCCTDNKCMTYNLAGIGKYLK